MAVVRYTDTAIAVIEGIHARIARDSPRYADDWLDQLQEAIERLMKYPYSGKIIPELKLPDRGKYWLDAIGSCTGSSMMIRSKYFSCIMASGCSLGEKGV